MKSSCAACTSASLAPSLGRPASPRLSLHRQSLYYRPAVRNHRRRGERDEDLRDPPGKGLAGPEELGDSRERSKEVAEDDFPQDIRWIRSYVIAEDGGTLGTVCIYQATSIEAVRDHAQRVGMPADEVLEVADTVVIRPDPQPEEGAACRRAGLLRECARGNRRAPSSRETHRVFNQPPPLEDYNPFDADRPLVEALVGRAPSGPRAEPASWRDLRLRQTIPSGSRPNEKKPVLRPTTATATGSTRSSSTAPGTN